MVSVEAVFKLLDEASGPLRKIRAEAKETDKALRSMGSGSTSGNFNAAGMTRQFTVTRDGINSIGDATKKLGDASKETKKGLDDAKRSADDFATNTDRKFGILRRTVSALLSPVRGLFGLFKDGADFVGRKFSSALDTSMNKMRPFSGAISGVAKGVGGLVGAIGGVVTALPLMVTVVLVAAPAILALAGAVGALTVSLAAAAGGAAVLGGGLIGSFAVGIGAIASVAKPAITQLKAYEVAQKALNTAIASGNTAAIQQKQKALDALAKAHPGVAKLSDSLHGLSKRWQELSKPGQASFFKLAADGISTLKADMPAFASVVNKTMGAIQSSFKKDLEPFLKSDAFTGIVKQLGSIFRANLPGIMKGLAEGIKGFGNVLKVAAPTLKNFGSAFQNAMTNFQNFTASGRGKSAIRGMIDSFKEWVRLLHEAGRVLGSIVGGTSGPGTSVISHWADALTKLANQLAQPGGTSGVKSWFSKTLAETGGLFNTLKSLLGDVKALYQAIKPLGSAAEFIIRNLPPGAVTVMAAAFLGFKALSGAKSGVSAVSGFLGKAGRGDSFLKPLFAEVKVVNKGAFGGGGSGSSSTKTHADGSKTTTHANGSSTTTHADGSQTHRAADGSPLPSPPRSSGTGGAGAAGVGGTLAKFGAHAAVAAAPIAALIGYLTSSGSPVHRARSAADVVDPTQLPLISAVWNKLFGKSLTSLVFDADHGPPRGTSTPMGFRPAAKGAFTGGTAPKQGALFTPTGGIPTFISPASVNKAGAAVDNLHDHSIKQAQDMGKKVGKSLADMVTSAVGGLSNLNKKGSNSASNLHDTVTNLFQDMTKNVSTESQNQGKTVDSLTSAVSTGLNQMIEQVNKALKSFGVGKMVAAVAKAGQGAASAILKFAGGGRIPGKPSGDHVPLVGRGGGLLGIADGGELVVNRHTESRVNSKLARFGTSLGKEVAGETRPHFATGGRASGLYTASMFGGPSDPGTGSVGYRGDNLYQHPDSYAELNMGTALGNLPYMAPLNVGYNGKQATLYKRDIGAGGPGIGGHPRAIDLWFQAAQKLGFSGLGLVNINSGAGTGATAGGGAPHIRMPTLGGPSGSLRSIGQAGLARGRRAAQKFVNAQVPSTQGGLGGAPALSGPAAVRAMIREADQIASHHYNYEWGGGHGALGVPGHGTGHGSGPGVGFDCSGAVSAVLGAAGLVHSPLVSGNYMGWGAAGPGKDVSIYASPSHVFMEIMGHYFGTSGMNPGGGADWIPHFPESMPSVRHPPGMATGGVLPGGVNWDELPPQDRQKLKQNPWGSLPGMAEGGRIPWYGKGADFVARRPQLIGVGDGPRPERVTVTPEGQKGGGVRIGQLIVQNHRPGDVREQIKREIAQAFDDLGAQLDNQAMEDSDSVMLGG